MARRLTLSLILACAALAAPAAAHASELQLHDHDHGAEPATAKEALRLARDLRDGERVHSGRELSVALRELAEKLPQLEGADRRRAVRLLARPTQGQGSPGEDTYAPGTVEQVRCSAHFCVHWVTTTEDAPPGGAAYAQTMLDEFENVYNVENVQMGWAPPKPDGALGTDVNKTDVYIKNIGPEGLFGYASADPGQGGQQWFSYLVMDNDYTDPAFASRYPGNPIAPLRVTAAHEYNHVLQYSYDGLQDSWMFEATATWMEDKVYDEVNDYVGYLGEWAKRSPQPLTQFNPPESGDSNAKVYGSAVFNRWIDTRFGQDTIRRAWEVSLATRDFAPAAYNQALAERGSSFFDVFTQFAADTAEWRAANSPFEEGSSWPDVQRALGGGSLAAQDATGDRTDSAGGELDHTGYALIPVNPSGRDSLTAGATLPRGVSGAIAIVGRTGGETGGNAVTKITRLPNGGAGRVRLDGASGFSRVTAVLINADIDVRGFNNQRRDWNWLGDDAPVTVAINDFTKPGLRKSSPRRNAKRVSRKARISLTFSEVMTGITSSTVKLVAPGGRTVAASVVPNGRTLKIVPSRRLAAGKRYAVRLSGRVTDAGGNALPSSKRIFRFTTGR